MVDAYKAGNQAARPNLVSYVSLVNAIVRTGDNDAAQRAEDVLFEMLKQYEDGDFDVKPNARVIALVMDCWQKSGKREAGEKAEALLNWMLKIYDETKDNDFQPNEYICSLGSSKCTPSLLEACPDGESNISILLVQPFRLGVSPEALEKLLTVSPASPPFLVDCTKMNLMWRFHIPQLVAFCKR